MVSLDRFLNTSICFRTIGLLRSHPKMFEPNQEPEPNDLPNDEKQDEK
jgi:hypothetical protein